MYQYCIHCTLKQRQQPKNKVQNYHNYYCYCIENSLDKNANNITLYFGDRPDK